MTNKGSKVYVAWVSLCKLTKWQTKVTIVVPKEYYFSVTVMVDSGANLNCFSKGLIPSRYFLKTTEILNAADGRKLVVNYKLQNSIICNKKLDLKCHL